MKVRKACVEFDDPTYLLLRREAKEFDISIADYIRYLVEIILYPKKRGVD